MRTAAVVMHKPKDLAVDHVDLIEAGARDVVVEIDWSGVSAGTERLLWEGRMPAFPGMGYPLVPGYESAGRVVSAGADAGLSEGDTVFVPGANCFQNVRGLFGGAARHLVVAAARAVPLRSIKPYDATLLALAATAYHAAPLSAGQRPDLIVGHGVLGRLLARLACVDGGLAPVVWERNAARRDGANGYRVIDPSDDDRRDYRCICDVSGDPAILDTLIARLAPGGEIVLAGFYHAPLSFAFPPAFMREARLRVAAQFLPTDLIAVRDLIESGRLDLDGLITHARPATAAPAAYRTAFEDPACLKMILDWRAIS